MNIRPVGSIPVALAVVVMLGGLTGCGDPCAGLEPNSQDKIVFENGGEVEREGRNGTECEASRETNGQFVKDD